MPGRPPADNGRGIGHSRAAALCFQRKCRLLRPTRRLTRSGGDGDSKETSLLLDAKNAQIRV